MDEDTQASATDWAEQRPSDLPNVTLVRTHRRASMYQTKVWQNRLPDDTDRIIIDAASISNERNLDEHFRQSDLVIVPILPSSIDIRAGSKFIAELLTHKAYRVHPLPIGVVANRVHRNTSAHAQLMRFLECLDVPTVATFSDNPIYTKAAEEGTGVLDLGDSKAAKREQAEWLQLVRWIDAQPLRSRDLRRAGPARAAIGEKIAAAQPSTG